MLSPAHRVSDSIKQFNQHSHYLWIKKGNLLHGLLIQMSREAKRPASLISLAGCGQDSMAAVDGKKLQQEIRRYYFVDGV